MFKRIIAWFKRPKPPTPLTAIPDDARYVVVSNRVLWPGVGLDGRLLVVPPETDVVIEPVVTSGDWGMESRQDYLTRNPPRSAKERGREWQINQLPDACLFR